MVSRLEWTAAHTVLALEASGASLATGTIVEANDAAYNGDTDFRTHGWLEFTGTFSVAPSVTAPVINVYIAQQADGTNYDDVPITGGVDCVQQFLLAIPVRKVTSAQRKVVGPFLLPPHDVKFYIDNQTGQTLSSAWTLKLFSNTLESQ